MGRGPVLVPPSSDAEISKVPMSHRIKQHAYTPKLALKHVFDLQCAGNMLISHAKQDT